MTPEYTDGDSLSLRTYAAILQYEESRLRHFGVGDDKTGATDPEVALAREARDLAMQIWAAASKLVIPTGVAQLYSSQRIDLDDGAPAGERLRGLVLEELAIGAAYAATDEIEEMAERCLEISDFALRYQPNEAVVRYLTRVGRCYVAGFFSECVILCRASVENGVRDAFDRRGIPMTATPQGQSSMRARLDAAVMFGWLSPLAREHAATVWRRGNVAVHHDPNATYDVLGTIELSMVVLDELYS
jgi:hypothetical protein